VATRLHPVGLTKCRSHGSVVAAIHFAGSVGGAERVQTGVEDEYRTGLGQIVDCPGHRLRMDVTLLRAGLACLSNMSSHFCRSNLVPEAGVVLGGDLIEQQLKGRTSRAGDAQHGWCTPSKHLRPFVDLDNGFFAWQEIRVGIIRANH